jgi:aspartyl-tRNA(Asn)/glutamyl-tRNA(Gln) amidotransferase subunit C
VKIDAAEVRRIAALASLDLDEGEIEAMTRQLGSILDYMDNLGRLDTSSVEPTFQPVGDAGPMRDDTPRPGLSDDDATRGAPPLSPGTQRPHDGSPGRFLVPRVIG